MEKYSFCKNEDVEVDLVDLLFYVLKRWRSILVAIVIGAISLGILGGVKGYPSLSEEVDNSKYETEWADYENAKDNYGKSLANMKERLEYTREYALNSIKMMINPYEEYYWDATYYLTLEEQWDEVTIDEYQRRVAAILSAYTSRFESNAIEEYFEVAYPDEDMRYLKELCEVSTNTATSTITISVIADTQERLDNLSACMKELLQDTNLEWKVTAEEHTLTQLSSANGVRIDAELAAMQEATNSKVLTLEQDIYNKQRQLDELKEPVMAVSATISDVIKNMVKYAVIGAVAGAVLLVGIYFMIYLFSGCIYTQEDMRAKYEVEVLATRRGNECRNVIDKILYCMSGEAGRELPEPVFLEVAAAKIASLAEGCKIVALTGSVSVDTLQELAVGITEKLDGIELVVAGNLAKSGEAIFKVNDVEAVLLVEERGKSKTCTVEAQLRYVAGCKKTVIGAILL